MKNIAIVVGHHENSKGAYSDYFCKNEWDFYNDVIKYLHNVKIFHHDKNISGYITRIKDTAVRLDKENFDLVIELHFNSFFEPSANGCETLYYYANESAKNLAIQFTNLVNRRTGIKVRGTGAKALANRNDRGFASVYYPKAPVLLIEPFFGSNTDDCKMIGCTKHLAEIINDFIESI
jgi:N-acetylmuramoyl-L-alanine amidase